MSSICLPFKAMLFALIFVASFQSASAQTRVIDGDTIEHNNVVYRLHGIDAPEAGQKCNKVSGGSWACGKAAIAFIERLVLNSAIVCDDKGLDGYGRTIAVCLSDGNDINEAIVAAGMAWAYIKYSNDYSEAEKIARDQSIGIWQATTQPPWAYRASKWQVGVQKAPKGCPIKGNISRNGRIYHAPWSPWYNRTKVSLNKGERWFCNEAEALKAGWRAPYWGR